MLTWREGQAIRRWSNQPQRFGHYQEFVFQSKVIHRTFEEDALLARFSCVYHSFEGDELRRLRI